MGVCVGVRAPERVGECVCARARDKERESLHITASVSICQS